jgi:hypothetical protein
MREGMSRHPKENFVLAAGRAVGDDDFNKNNLF